MGQIQRLPIARNSEEAWEYLRRERSYIGEVSLDLANLGEAGGLEFPYPGYGLYMSYQGTPPGAQLRVLFDRDFNKSILFRPGTLHKPGPVEKHGRRATTYFDQLHIQRTVDSVEEGTVNFVVLGTPEAQYDESPGRILEEQTFPNLAKALTTVATFYVGALKSVRLYLHTSSALDSVQILISPDYSNWEEVLTGQFSGLGAGVLRSREVPKGVEWLRVRATAAGIANTTAWIVGHY